MENRGTKEGTEEEILFVKEVNSNLERYRDFLNIECPNFLLVHISSHIYGEIQKKKIFSKADAYAIEIINKNIYSELTNYYISEKNLRSYAEEIDFHKIPYTGISIKLATSQKYQIAKINPSSFKKIFTNSELGAGASVYTRNLEDLPKNKAVLKGWGITNEMFIKYFEKRIFKKVDLNNQQILQSIKTFSNEQISKQIKNNKAISDYIFKGVGNFPEPYTAHFIFENNQLKKIENICKFKVTTGSGRSHGDFTIVIKPC